MDFKNKYLKYKNKYLQLKKEIKQKGAGIDDVIEKKKKVSVKILLSLYVLL